MEQIKDTLKIDLSLRLLEEMGYSNEESTEKQIIDSKEIIDGQETIFIVKDYIDNDKSLPCFNGVAFISTEQITSPAGDMRYVLCDNLLYKFLTTKQTPITNENIVGFIKCNYQSIGNNEFVYKIIFTPTKKSVLNGVKTEKIYSIIENFIESFKNKNAATKEAVKEETIKLKKIIRNLKYSAYPTPEEVGEFEKQIIDSKENIFLVTDWVDGDKKYPCIKGVGIYYDEQIKMVNILTKTVSNNKIYVLCSSEDNFEFIGTPKNEDKIIGNIQWSKHLNENDKIFYALEFTPSKEANIYFNTKKDEIYSIIKSFKYSCNFKMSLV